MWLVEFCIPGRTWWTKKRSAQHENASPPCTRKNIGSKASWHILLYQVWLLVDREALRDANVEWLNFYCRYRGAVFADAGDFQRCIALWMYALDMQQANLDPLSPMTLSSLLSFAELFSFMQKVTQITLRWLRPPSNSHSVSVLKIFMSSSKLCFAVPIDFCKLEAAILKELNTRMAQMRSLGNSHIPHSHGIRNLGRLNLFRTLCISWFSIDIDVTEHTRSPWYHHSSSVHWNSSTNSIGVVGHMLVLGKLALCRKEVWFRRICRLQILQTVVT